MSESKKLTVGTELSDEELMEMTGGATFSIACQKQYTYTPTIPTLKYGIIAPEYGIVVAKYGIQPMYGIEPQPRLLYGIQPY